MSENDDLNVSMDHNPELANASTTSMTLVKDEENFTRVTTSRQPSLDTDQIVEQIQEDFGGLETELPNIALDAEELATLSDLIARYDQVIQNLDALNEQIENLLSEESIKGCDS